MIVAAGAWFHESEVGNLRAQRENELAAVGALKARSIAHWRNGIYADAKRAQKSPFLTEHIYRLVHGAATEADRRALGLLLGLDQQEGAYTEVLLVIPDGGVLLSTADPPGTIARATGKAIATARATTGIAFSDLYRDSGGRVVIDCAAPVSDAQGDFVALLVLRQDAASFLYPELQSLPTPSKTAETLLVERDEDSVVFLNPLRHRPEAALSLRLPLTRQDLPAVRAVMGDLGVFEGVDYRGTPVLTDLRAIEGTSWALVTKVDADEALAAVRVRSRLVSSLIGTLILFVSATVGYFFRRRESQAYRTLANAERQQRLAEQSLRTTLYSIGDGVISADAEGCVRIMNPVAEKLTGWAEADAVGIPIEHVFCIVNEESRAVVESPVKRVLREGKMVGLANHTVLVAKDGIEHPIADSGAPIRDERDAIQGVVLVFRDQTEERRKERELARLAAECVRSEELMHVRVRLLEHSATNSMEDVLVRAADEVEALTASSAGVFCLLESDERTVSRQVESTHAVDNPGGTPNPGHPRDGSDALRWIDCARERRPIIYNHCSEPSRRGSRPCRDEAQCRTLAVPVLRDQKVVAVLGVADKPTDYTKDDLAATALVADVAWEIAHRKRAEAERERLRASLAQADRLASMGMLAAGVAHEINNPLSYVLYNLESVLDELPRLVDLMRRCQAMLSPGAGQTAAAGVLGNELRAFRGAVFEDWTDRLREALTGTQRIKAISLGVLGRGGQPKTRETVRCGGSATAGSRGRPCEGGRTRRKAWPSHSHCELHRCMSWFVGGASV